MAINSIKNLFDDFFKKNQNQNNSVSISNKGIAPKKVLMIFPFEKDFFRVASYAYRNLPHDKNKSSFYYLVNESYIDSFSLRKGEIINLNFDNNNITNQKDVISKLELIKFDVLVDLNITFQQNIEKFINLDADIKIGFKHKKSDLLYNIQLDISKSEIAEKGYQQIINLI